jgi:hypothetical protein
MFKELMTFRAVLLLILLSLGFTQALVANDFSQTTSSVYTFPVHDASGAEVEPPRMIDGAEASLMRMHDAIRMSVHAAELPEGHVVTAWWVIFNKPSLCSDGVCGEDDVLPMPGNVLADVSVLHADGAYVGASGSAFYFDHLKVGDTANAVFGPGLLDPHGAEVHLVLRTHGTLNPEQAHEQQSTINGGCDPDPPHAPCQDLQFAIFYPDRSALHVGERVPMGDGYVESWIELDSAGNPSSLGISISEAAFMSLPDEITEWSLALPSEASATPFTHMGLDWNPSGHEPPGVYDLPHFDIHFNIIDEESRLAISADDPNFEVIPDAQFLPADYEKIPGGVPRMGAHWIDTQSPEFQSEVFSSTMIYGSYEGHVIFVEPMITWDFIHNSAEFSAAIKQPDAYEVEGVFYPTTYGFRFDEEKREYRISIDGFVER